MITNCKIIIRDFKKHTSKQFISAIKEGPESRGESRLAKFSYAANRLKKGVNFKVWKDGFHLIILDNHLTVEQRVNYIHYNPVALVRVYHESDCKNSSYAAYEEGNREIPAVKLNPLW